MSSPTSPPRSRILPGLVVILVLLPIAYRVYRAANSVDIGSIYRTALIELENRNFPNVLVSAEKLSASGIDPRYAMVLEAALDVQANQWPKAASLLQAPMAFQATAPLAHTLMGQILYRNKQFSAAIPVLNKAIDLDPKQVDAHRWLAACYFDIGATEPAIRELERVSSLAPTDPRPHRTIALIYKDMENFAAAINEYRESLRRSKDFPDRPSVLRELADCLLQVGKHSELDDVLRECAVDPVTLTYAAQSQQARGDRAKANELVSQALAMDPKFVPGLLLKASLSAEAGEFQEAVDILQTAVQMRPLDHRVHYQLAQTFVRLGDKASAEKHATESTRLRDLRVHFSELHAKASINLNDAEIRYQLGLTANQLGMKDLATSWFSAALALNPGHSQAADELNKLRTNLISP